MFSAVFSILILTVAPFLTWAQDPSDFDCQGALRSQTEFLSDLDSLFDRIEKVQDRSSIHPDRVLLGELEKLKPGTELFLDPESFRHARPPELDGRRISSREVYPVRVIKASKGKIVLYSPSLGDFSFGGDNYFHIMGHLYRRHDYSERSVFEVGEYVQVGFPGGVQNRQPLFLRDPGTGRMDRLEVELQPVPAKFIRAINLNQYEVYFEDVHGLGPMRSSVPANEVFQFRYGTIERVREALRILDEIPSHFQVNERIRYTRGGLMGEARIVELKDRSIVLDRGIEIPYHKAFKTWTRGRPQSVGVDTSPYIRGSTVSRVHLKLPSGLLREYLNGVARLASHPEFQEADIESKLKILVRFQNLFLPWREGGQLVEFSGISEFSALLCAGVGVCRHSVPLMAATLTEAGLNPKIFFRYADKSEAIRLGMPPHGHTWLQVNSKTSPSIEYIVDPSMGSVMTMEEAEMGAQNSRDSAEAIWWTSPDRVPLKIERLKEEN